MSSTIGFGLSTKASINDLKKKIRELSNLHEYFVSFDLNVIESEVASGVESLAKQFDFNLICILHSPPRHDVALAYDIDVELAQLESVSNPIFFRFLTKFSEMLKDCVEEYTVFFADEWYSDMRIRRIEGTTDDLIGTLKKAGGWGIILFNLKRNWWEVYEDFPLVYTVKL